MSGLRRPAFADSAYAALTIELRHAHNPAAIFGRLNVHGLIVLRDTDEDVQAAIDTTTSRADAITVEPNEEVRSLNERIGVESVGRGGVDDARTEFGSDTCERSSGRESVWS